MKTKLAKVAAFAALLLAAASAAHAGTHVDWSVTIGSSPGMIYAPAPVYSYPQPVYVEPSPVYVAPRPVYVAPPRVVYSQPYYYGGHRHHYHGHGHRHGHRHGHGHHHGHGHGHRGHR